MSSFFNPVKVFTEEAGVEQLAKHLGQRFKNIDRILVLTRGDNVHLDPMLAPLFSVIKTKEFQVEEIALSNPDLTDFLKLNHSLSDFDYRFIVAIGGGSVLDVAKAIAALKDMPMHDVNEIRNNVVNQTYVDKNAMIPWVGIPTTSGTGSEVTSWATIWDKALGKKYSITDERLYAEACLIAPELTVTQPVNLSVSTALDTLSHATEAYWSNNTNPITRIYSLEAITIIRVNLPKLQDNLESLAIRSKLAKASLFAGLAFSNTRTTACHSISYPLTLLHGVNHGLAASLTLGAMLKINAPTIVDLDKLLAAYGVKKVEAVDSFITSIFKQYDLQYELGFYGVDELAVPQIVNSAYTKGRMDNNPVEITEGMLTTLLLAKI